MNINDLETVLTPPTTPNDVHGRPNWPEIQSRLGLALPKDYKSYIEIFGTGKIADFLWVYSPLSSHPSLNLFHQSDVVTAAHREFRSRFPEKVPFNVFPESGGLLPWGGTDNGDMLFWLTDDAAESWTTVVYASRGEEYALFRMPMTRFIRDVLSRQLICRIFPYDFPRKTTFAPDGL